MENTPHEFVQPQGNLPVWLHLHKENQSGYFAPHWHQSIEISYTISGKIDQFFLAGELYQTYPGCILVANTMEVHSIHAFPSNDNRALSVLYPYDLVQRFFPDINHYQIALNHPEELTPAQEAAYAHLASIYEDMAILLDSQDKLAELKLAGLAHQSLAILLEHFLVARDNPIQTSQDNKVMERLQGIKSYIDSHYQADLSLDDIAQAAYLSKEYLSRFFKEYMGETVMDYVNAVRASQAKKAIEQGRGTFTQIAQHTGFSGLRSMDRALIKNYGKRARDLKAARND